MIGSIGLCWCRVDIPEHTRNYSHPQCSHADMDMDAGVSVRNNCHKQSALRRQQREECGEAHAGVLPVRVGANAHRLHGHLQPSIGIACKRDETGIGAQ